jgi:hypothetical protein
MDREIDRCRREIAEIEAELLAGNPDVAGLCMALSDWWAELRILERQKGLLGNEGDHYPVASSGAGGSS